MDRSRRVKQFLPDQAYNAGFSNLLNKPGSRARVKELQKAAGGTNETVTWVYACIKRIAEAGGGYPWQLHKFTGNIQAPGDVVENPDAELTRVIALPNPRQRMTYTLATQLKLCDLEVSGNSYWLKDRRNALGQPAEMFRLRPELTKIAKDRQGNKLGYVFYPAGGDSQGIPYDLDEVIHYRYPSLLDDHYGMGTLEAIVRTVNTELSQSEHVLGFFDGGAQIGGLLIAGQDVGADEFEGLKAELSDEIRAGGENGILMVENAMDFKPITLAPPGSGVIELRRMGKDEILSGFGVHEFMLGGSGQSGTERMREAIHIFNHQTVAPKMHLLCEQTTLDLTALWMTQIAVEVRYSQPFVDVAEGASKMLEAGASVNQSLKHMGLPPSDHEDAEKPMIKSTVKPLGQEEIQRVEINQPPSNGDGNELPAGEEPGDVEEIAEDDPAEPGKALKVPNLEQFAVALARELTKNGVGHGNGNGNSLQPSTPIQLSEGANDDPGTPSTGFAFPDLPDGFEEWGDWDPAQIKQVGDEILTDLVNAHARVLRRGTVRLRSKFTTFFHAQEARVLARLDQFAKMRRVAGQVPVRYNSEGKALGPDDLWDEGTENAALDSMYMPLVDEIGADALPAVNRMLGMQLRWDLENPHIDAARSKLAKLVKRINETTRGEIAAQVEEGLRRGYPITRIANGYEPEDYPGIQGVFREATAARVETIARTETAYMFNAAIAAGYKEGAVLRVVILDGIGDPECADANGSEWTVEEFEANPIAHPNCVRTAAPVL